MAGAAEQERRQRALSTFAQQQAAQRAAEIAAAVVPYQQRIKELEAELDWFKAHLPFKSDHKRLEALLARPPADLIREQGERIKALEAALLTTWEWPRGSWFCAACGKYAKNHNHAPDCIVGKALKGVHHAD